MARRKNIIFDGDATQWTDGGSPCSLCGFKPHLEDAHTTLIRVRERHPGEPSTDVGFICPDCAARVFLQVTRLGLWKAVNKTLIAAIQRALRLKTPRLEGHG